MFSSLLALFNQFTRFGNQYQLAATLEGHKGGINTLTFNRDTSLLASGGNDEVVKIWDMKTVKILQTITDPNGQWGQITCAKFIAPDPSSEYLCFGTGRGHFLIYRRLRRSENHAEVSNARAFPAGDSVETFAFDPIHHRLAVTSHHGIIKVYKFNNNNGTVTDLWKEDFPDAIPRAISFADKGNSIVVYGLETGAAVCLDSETAVEKFTRTLKSSIGNVANCPLSGSIVVDNMTDGFDAYTLPRTTPTRHFSVPMNKKYVKKAVYAERGSTIVGGSDHGTVYVFEIESSEARQTLVHGKKDAMIQTVEAATSANHFIIGSGAATAPFNIRIWQKPIKQVASQRRKRNNPLEILILINLIVVLLMWTAQSWIPVVEARAKFVSKKVAKLARDIHAELLPTKHQRSPLRVDPVQALLSLDEDTLRRLLGVPEVTNDGLHNDYNDDDEELDELD